MDGESGQSLRGLEERLGRATKAAERLIAEASRSRAGKPPPAGWQAADEEQQQGSRPAPELEALIAALRSLRSLRELIPPEVSERLLAALREVLLAIRGLLDFYVERLERRSSEPPEVEDIPIQ